jgi:uncharacterized protein
MRWFNVVLIGFILFSVSHLKAQNTQPTGIEVTGSAEMSLVPDEIHFHLSISEYMKSGKRISLDEVEKTMQKAVLAAGLSLDRLKLEQANSYPYAYDENGKTKREFFASKQYVIKMSSQEPINKIMEKLDPLSVKSTYIGKISHSKLAEYQKELRIKAMQAAREKATYMLAAVGSTPGKLVYAQDMEGEGFYPMARASNMMMERAADSSMPTPLESVEIKEMQLRIQVRAVFEIR